MLNSQQPPTQISSHAQLLEIFIEVDQRGDADVGVDVDVNVDVDDNVDVHVLSRLRKTKEGSTIQRNTTALSNLANIKVIKYVIWCFLSW